MQEHASPIRVDVSPDGLVATLSIPSGTPKGEVDAMNVQALMAERGIGISPERQSVVREAIAAYSESAESYTCVVARGVAPSDGVDGSVAVLPEVLRPVLPQEKLDARAGKDHHARLQIVTVRKGQRVGTLTRPTTGVDGVDVRGQSIAARAGRGSPTKLDASILVQPDGSLIAATDGVVELDADGLRVSGTLRLASVDFSSGNVEFSGDILVQGQVRDGFRVRASKAVRVRGLVDAATLESGSDVLLDKGMASAKGGRIECGRDLRVPCLNNITCNVARDAYVGKELQDCKMVIGRKLVAMEAAIVRGETTVAGGAEVGSLGCEAHSETLFHVARAPVIDTLSQQLCGLAPLIASRRDRAAVKLDEISKQKETSHKLAELTTELRFEIDSANSQANKLVVGCNALLAWSGAQTKAELIVRREVFPGAKVVIGAWAFEVSRRVAGPVKFFVGEGGVLMVTDLAVGRTFPASDIAKVQTAANVPNLGAVAAMLSGDRAAA